jgi:hypothetical protein
MGLLAYLKRLLGLGSSAEAIPCRVCGVGVPESDLAKGRAVVLARRAYCRRCVAERTSGSGSGSTSGRLMDSSSHVSV